MYLDSCHQELAHIEGVSGPNLMGSSIKGAAYSRGLLFEEILHLHFFNELDNYDNYSYSCSQDAKGEHVVPLVHFGLVIQWNLHKTDTKGTSVIVHC